MEKFTQKQLRSLVTNGVAIDLTHALSYADAGIESGDYLKQIGYAAGIYGCNGKLLKSSKTGQLYAVTRRTNALYIF